MDYYFVFQQILYAINELDFQAISLEWEKQKENISLGITVLSSEAGQLGRQVVGGHDGGFRRWKDFPTLVISLEEVEGHASDRVPWGQGIP